MGTGLFNPNNQTRGKFQTRLLQQTSLNLPSMMPQEKQSETNRVPQGIKARKRTHSIFTSNFQADNVIIDQNYTRKGSNENQRIAWEIKFNHSYKKDAAHTAKGDEDSFTMPPEVSQGPRNKSFKVTNRPVKSNFNPDKSQISNQSNNFLN